MTWPGAIILGLVLTLGHANHAPWLSSLAALATIIALDRIWQVR
jgi:hypothetical protein